ncbi:hypothetical protein VNO77_21991 [Canavalia gladiata]|uniref:TRF2/HOY1 PH-like domain-containing protein n=1 Tax=Canavalia gladiata TaxID=3824 RepID=A0AAN9L512_CANGL
MWDRIEAGHKMFVDSTFAANSDGERHMKNQSNVTLENYIKGPLPVGTKDKSNATCQKTKKGASTPKAVHFHATLLKIGAFQKLMWDIQDEDTFLKHRIEIQWWNILAMHAAMEKNKSGILEIELDKPPTFSHETSLRSKRPSSFEPLQDFTQGQALTYRRHYLEFSPGVLDKYYAELLQFDKRLLKLSQVPYPSLIFPYFDPKLPLLYQGTTNPVLDGTTQTNATNNDQPPIMMSSQQTEVEPFGNIGAEGDVVARLDDLINCSKRYKPTIDSYSIFDFEDPTFSLIDDLPEADSDATTSSLEVLIHGLQEHCPPSN